MVKYKHVKVYVFMYDYMHACMYVYIYVCMYVSTYVCINITTIYPLLIEHIRYLRYIYFSLKT